MSAQSIHASTTAGSKISQHKTSGNYQKKDSSNPETTPAKARSIKITVDVWQSNQKITKNAGRKTQSLYCVVPRELYKGNVGTHLSCKPKVLGSKALKQLSLSLSLSLSPSPSIYLAQSLSLFHPPPHFVPAPSSCMRNSVFNRRLASFSSALRIDSIESTSSMKITAG